MTTTSSKTLSFGFNDQNGNSGYGEIVGYDTNLDGASGQSIYQATDGYIHFNLGAQDYLDRYYFKDISTESTGSDWNIDGYDPFFEFPANNGNGYAWTNKYNYSSLWEYNNPGVVFTKSDSPQAVGLWSIGDNMALSLYDPLINEWHDYTLLSFEILENTQESIPFLLSTTASSNQLILTFSEDIQIAGGGTLNPAYITVTVDGQARKVTRSEILPLDQPSIHTASRLALTLSGRSLDSASSVSIAYNPPTNGSNTGFITDLEGNALAPISTQVVDTWTATRSMSKRGLAAAYKNLILAGTNTTGFGNTQDNTITGNDTDNTLDGLAGADIMLGKGGNDTYFVENTGDVATEISNEGTDTVQSVITYALGDHVENLVLIGSSAINGAGNSADNTITGNGAANILNGNGGCDSLIGSRGNDTYIIDSIDDAITEAGSSSDVDSVQSSVSWVLGTNLENLTLTESSAVNGTGNNLNNTISGNAESNILDGGSGGTDRLTGLDGADTFKFSTRPAKFRNTSADHITDFSSPQGDKIQITKSTFGITGYTATLSVVSGESAVKSSLSTAAMFIYDTSSGELHWNQNGIAKGAGSGGILAILDNKATLSAGDLMLV